MAASFDRDHLRRHGIADEEIDTQQVACHTVESASAPPASRSVDLIQIDAEGYDWPIIRSIDFARVRPRILRFEYRHMPARDADACLALLASHGYPLHHRNARHHRASVDRASCHARAAATPQRVVAM